MKTLFAAILVALFAVCGCDAASDETDLSYTEIGFSDVNTADATEEVDPEQSASPVPVSNGLDVRLVWTCGAEKVTGYGYTPNLLVTPGTEGQDFATYHDEISGNVTGLINQVTLYKGAEEWDPSETNYDLCKPNSGNTSEGYALPVVPSTPDEYLITVRAGHASDKPSYKPNKVWFVPNADLTVEVLCHGVLVESVILNPVEMGVEVNTGLDVMLVHTSAAGCKVDVLDLAKENRWCPHQEGGCGL